MSFRTHRPGPTLSVVRNAHDAAQADHPPETSETRADGTLDWSILMAHAQSGDRHAYRRLLEAITPYLRALAARQIANRRIVDGLRRQGRLGVREAPFDPEHETFQAAEANLQEEAVDASMLRDAVEHLPAGRRDAVRMLKLEEMSLKEAAAASGMSVAALLSALSGLYGRRLFGWVAPRG